MKLQTLARSAVSGYTARNETYEGRAHIVVPCIALIEGVHSGSEGPVFYPAAEIERFAEAWNGEPIVVDHPVNRDGAPVSASAEPAVAEKVRVGRIFGAAYDPSIRGLRYELWLDERLMKEHDPNALARLQRGEVMEVSTGLYADDDGTPGEWNGEQYASSVRNIRPDHLALLPHSMGACSVADGCGVRANGKGGGMVRDAMVVALQKAGYFVMEIGHNEIRRALQGAVDALDTRTAVHVVTEVYDSYFVYEKMNTGDGGAVAIDSGGPAYFKRDYTVDNDGKVTIAEAVEEVRRTVDYVPVTANAEDPAKGGEAVKKDELVQSLIGCECTRFTNEDEDWLTKMTVNQLEKMQAVPAEEKPEEEEPNPETKEAAHDEATPNSDPESTVAESSAGDGASEEAPKTAEEYIQQAPDGIREVLNDALERHTAEKEGVVSALMANKKNGFTEAELKSKSLKELKTIANLADVERPADYSGRGNRPVSNEDPNAIPEAPSPWATQ